MCISIGYAPGVFSVIPLGYLSYTPSSSIESNSSKPTSSRTSLFAAVKYSSFSSTPPLGNPHRCSFAKAILFSLLITTAPALYDFFILRSD